MAQTVRLSRECKSAAIACVCDELESILSLIQRSGIRDALAVLLHGKGVDDKRGGAKQPCVHSGRGLAGDKFIHERRVNAAAKLAEALGQYKVGLRRIDLVVS